MEVWEICSLVKQISDRLKAAGDMSMKKHGLTFSQLRVLEFVQNKGGETTQKEIEDYLGVAHPTVVGLVTRLEKSGFLYCHMDESNRRNKICCLTRRASDLKRVMDEERRAAAEWLVRGLSQQEQEELRRLLRVLCRNLE